MHALRRFSAGAAQQPSAGRSAGMEHVRELSGGFEGALPDDLDLQLDDDVLMALLGDSMDDMADLPMMQPEQPLLQGQEPQQQAVQLVQQHQQTLSPLAPPATAPSTVTATQPAPLPLPIAHMMPPVQPMPKFEQPSFFPGLPGFPPFPPHFLYPFAHAQAQLQATGSLMPLAPPQQPCAPAMPKHTPTQQQKHKVGIAPKPVPSGVCVKRKLDVGFVGAGGSAGDVVGGQAKRGPVDDPADSKEVKKQKRLIRNRLSAQLHRERQRQHVDQLEQTIKEKDVDIARLQTRVDELEKENCSLCAQLNHLRTHARAPSGAGSTQSDSGYTTSGTVSGGTSPVRSDSDSEAQGYLSDASGSGTRPGSMLFSFLLLFTFLAAPSTFLVTKNWTTDTRTTNPLSGLLSSSTWRVHSAKATTTRHIETPQLPGPDTIRRIVKPNMDRSLSTAVTSRALMSVQDMSSASTASHRDSVGPVVSPEALTAATGSPASSSRIPQQTDFVLHPFERRPETWRHKIQELNCAPWQYTESLDLLGGNSTVSREWPSEREEVVIARPDNGGRLRGRGTQHSKPVEYAVDVYRASDHSSKQVDIYRDHNPAGSSHGMSRSPATSYMFCPQAYGLMAHDLVREYWDVKRSGVDDDGKPRVPPYLGRNGAIVLPAGVATEEHTDHGDNARTADSSSQSTNSSSSTADNLSSAPYLLLLVPSGAVHWGGAAGGATMNGESSGQDAWLEVGCRLTSARIVSDVRFSV